MKIKTSFLFVLLAFGGFSVCAQKKNASEVVQEFYTFHLAADKTFNKAAIDARKKWFTAELNKLFLNELKRQDEFLKQNPTDKPYFGDGLSLEPLDECAVGNKSYPNIYRVQAADVAGGEATVAVKFFNPQQCGGAPLATYEVKLVKSENKWLIRDWVFEDGKTLTAALMRKDY